MVLPCLVYEGLIIPKSFGGVKISYAWWELCCSCGGRIMAENAV